MDMKAIRHALCSAEYDLSVTFVRAGHAGQQFPSSVPFVEGTCQWSSSRDGTHREYSIVGFEGAWSVESGDPMPIDAIVEFIERFDVRGLSVEIFLRPALKCLLEYAERMDAASGLLHVRWGHDRQGDDGAEVKASYTPRNGQRVMRGTVGIDPVYGSARSILNIVNAVVNPPADD